MSRGIPESMLNPRKSVTEAVTPTHSEFISQFNTLFQYANSTKQDELVRKLESLLDIDEEDAKIHHVNAVEDNKNLVDAYILLLYNWNRSVEDGSIVDDAYIKRRQEFLHSS
jgi:hypothetical protein